MRLSPLFLVTTLAAPVFALEGLVLVEDGQPRARIVLPRSADDNEKLAAEELNAFVAKITGAGRQITNDADGSGPKVLIGARDKALRLDQLKYGGFVMKRGGDTLTLAGSPSVGTLNAVYAFLEDVCGVRWYMPTELGENVPKKATLAVDDLDRREEPRFVNRRNHGLDLSIRGDGAAWRRRVRITSHDLDVPFNRYSHNFYTIFPATKYDETHPEYYPLRRGRRAVPSHRDHSTWQPCTTNADVFGITVLTARRWFDARPNTNFFSVGMNDSRGFCDCSRCLAMDLPGEEFRGRRMISDRYFAFVKSVADQVHKTHPDRYMTSIAYSVVESLPKYVTLPQNVGVIITQDVAQWHDPAYQAKDKEFARAWAKAAGAFGTYDYTGLTWLLPRVYPRLMAESLRFYDEIGAVAVTNEAFPSWWYAAPLMYLRAKLMWNPELDADAILNDFYRGFFGPAQKPMKGVYDVFERCMMKEREGRWFEGLSSVIHQLDVWERKDAVECRKLLAQAAQLAEGHKPYAERVAFVSRGWGWTDQILEEYWHAQEVERLASDAGTTGEQILAETLKLIDLTKARDATWQKLKSDRLVSGIYRLIDERFASRWGTWKAYLRKCHTVGLGSTTSVQGEIQPDRVRQLLSKVGEGELAEELRGLLWVAENPNAPNQCRNPGFEDARAQGPAPRGVDWVSTTCPPGWSKWALEPPSRERMTWEQAAGRSNSRCVRTKGAKNACFIQTFKAKPGQRYYCSALVRAQCSEGAKSQVRIQWKDGEGNWNWAAMPRIAQITGSTRTSGTLGPWHRLSVAFTVPKGVGQIVVLLTVLDQTPDDVTWFDGVRLVRIGK